MPYNCKEFVTVSPVKFPTEVIVGWAGLVTVAEVPATLPAIGPVTVKLDKVPKLVREDLVTLPASVVPVRVAASIIGEIVILILPSNATPLIFLGVASFVAVAELPVIFPLMGAVTVSPDKVPRDVMADCVGLVTVAAVPVTLPAMGLVTVKLVKVPKLVSEEFITLDASMVPLSVEASASAVIVILELPSKATPLIFLGVVSFVAVAELPVMPPLMGVETVSPDKVPRDVMADCVGLVTVAAVPVTLPDIKLVTVKLERVPRLVSDELTTLGAKVVEVKVEALAGTVISTVPVNNTPFMFRPVCN
jgi:hypothetical protein